ncbi:MAG: hypothetical protein WDZ46_06760 [Solirubrobacterales bacterium]
MSCRTLATLGAAVVALATLGAAPASAAFGIKAFDVQIAADPPADPKSTTTYAEGGNYSQAAGHPYAVVTHVAWNSHPDPIEDPNFNGLLVPEGDVRDTQVDLPPGMVGNPTAVEGCTAAQLFGLDPIGSTECPTGSQVGVVHIDVNFSAIPEWRSTFTYPLFNIEAPSGLPARFGFKVYNTPVLFDAALRQDGSYGITVGPRNAPQALRIYGSEITFWGNPSDPRHDVQRCNYGFLGWVPGTATSSACPGEPGEVDGPHAGGSSTPLLTMPTSCTPEGVGQPWTIRTDSWQDPGNFDTRTIRSHLPPYAPSGGPGPQEGTGDCHRVPFAPSFSALPTTRDGASSSGLDIGLSFPQHGLLNPDGLAQSHLNKAVVTLPEGMTVNPSQAEGLEVCSPAQYDSASLTSYGCPSESKIGTVEVKTPLLEETIPGNVYIAEPNDNPFDSLLALYIVLREPHRGILVQLPGEVEPDLESGQIRAIFDELPQLPFESFAFRFREGQRAPLITPSRCGTYETEALFYPWARPDDPVPTSSTFEVTSGPGGAPCPQGNVPPFDPGFSAGTLSNNAGSHSPFLMRITREDGEQDLTKFNATLPPGVTAKLAGVAKCPDEALAFAKTKTGRYEQRFPSCPTEAQIGSVLTGAGVGSTLVHVPGKVYLAGPFNGAPLSVAAIVPAVAGPFDVGTVVVRQALTLDPRTAEVKVDGERSDPIPHILAGIPLSVRDIRVSVDRPGFTLNPTSCDPSQVGATLFGSYLDLLSPADDRPVSAAERFQAGRLPRPASRAHPPPGRRQPLKGSGGLAQKRLPRTGPHPHDLHQGAIRGGRRTWSGLPQGLDLRLRQGLEPPARHAAAGSGLPALLKPQPARHGAGAQGPGRHRSGGEDRLRAPGRRGLRHPLDLQRDPGRPDLPRGLEHAGGQEGPDRQQPQPLRRQGPARPRELQGTKRRHAQLPAQGRRLMSQGQGKASGQAAPSQPQAALTPTGRETDVLIA